MKLIAVIIIFLSMLICYSVGWHEGNNNEDNMVKGIEEMFKGQDTVLVKKNIEKSLQYLNYKRIQADSIKKSSHD